jgi:hypothetical protein
VIGQSEKPVTATRRANLGGNARALGACAVFKSGEINQGEGAIHLR